MTTPHPTDVACALKRALTPLAEEMKFALLFGSIAKGTARPWSDIDVMVVSDTLWTHQVLEALYPVQEAFGMRVSPLICTEDEIRRLLARSNSFLESVLEGPHLMLFGEVMRD